MDKLLYVYGDPTLFLPRTCMQDSVARHDSIKAADQLRFIPYSHTVSYIT